MKKRLSFKLLVWCSSLLVTTVFAQSENDAKQQLKAKLSQLTTYQASFSQTVTDIENTVLQQAVGKIVLQQPDKLYWELLAPNESVLLADGTNIWNIDPFLEQVVVYSADSALENNPLVLLSNPESDKWQEYTVNIKDSQFVITPLVPNGGIEALKLVFDDDKLVELQSTDTQQQTSKLIFSAIQQNQAVADTQFVFVQPEGYELDDQRNL